MSDTKDFAMLYRQLGLRPGCSLHELRMAYRRRVARLHPDRNHGDVQALQQLNALYGAAVNFQRKMGRLPGARAARDAALPKSAHQQTATPQAEDTQTSSRRQPQSAHTTQLRTIALLLLMLLLAAVLWAAINSHIQPAPPASKGAQLGLETGAVVARINPPEVRKSPTGSVA